MRILQINCVYKKGSTGKIVHDIHTQLLAQGHESVVCYGRGDVIREPNVHKTCGEFESHVYHFFANLTGIMYGGCFFSTNRLISIIKKEKPDVVHLHCINGYFVNIYRLVTWLKKNHIRTVLTLHAEFMYTGGCAHAIDCDQWKKGGCGQRPCPYRQSLPSWFFDRTGTMWRRMQDAFRGDWPELTVVSVSPWLKSRAEQSAVLKEKQHCVVLNGTDTEIFHPCGKASGEQWRQKLGLGKKFVVFHATPNFSDDPHHLKGGYFVLELARQMPDVCFVVAGPARTGMDLPHNVTLLGSISDQKVLAQLYSMADLTLLTSRRETFSMVVAESLCCGTPVAGFRAGGPESIALEGYGFFVEYGDMAELKSLVEKLSEHTDAPAVISQYAAIYQSKIMAEGYIALYQKNA